MLNRRHPIDIIQAIPKRLKESHKGTYGRLLIVAGSRQYTGAALLMVESALRAGTGLIVVVTTHDAAQVIRCCAPEAIVIEGPESDGMLTKQSVSTIDRLAHEYDIHAMGIGPGIGDLASSQDFYDGVYKIITRHNWPVLVDAEAMAPLYHRVCKKGPSSYRFVFTPHPKEFTNMVASHTNAEKNKDVLVASKKSQQVIVYKTNATIVGGYGKIWQSSTGNEGLATAGSGDVLSGMVSGFLAQGVPPFDAAKLAVYMHGLTAELASMDLGLRSILARDLCGYIPKIFQELVQYHG